MFYGLSLSLSKMGTILFAIISIVFIYQSFTRAKHNVITIVKYFVLLFFILLIVVYNFDFTNIIDRFSKSNTNSLTTGRFELQSLALFKWLSSDLINLLFGYGIDTSHDLTKGMSNVTANVLHSIYVQTIVEQGIFGFLVITLFVKHIITGINIINFNTVMIFCISGLALSGLFYWDLILFYIVYDKLNQIQK